MFMYMMINLHKANLTDTNYITMKKISYILFGSLLAVVFNSCQEDDIWDIHQEELYIDVVGLLVDGGQISDVGLYCLEAGPYYKPWFEYYPEVKTLEDYSDIQHFCIIIHRDIPTYRSDDQEEMSVISEMEKEYYKEKAAFMIDAYEKYLGSAFYREAMMNHDDKHCWGWPELFTAYTTGEVSITCDKMLFGEEPGTNLSSYFTMTANNGCIPSGVDNPKLCYDFFDDKPTVMRDFFPDSVWLQPEYYLHFDIFPPEQYDSLTLTLTIPMLIEHSRNYVVAKYKGICEKSRYSNHSFIAECPIKFNWNK